VRSTACVAAEDERRVDARFLRGSSDAHNERSILLVMLHVEISVLDRAETVVVVLTHAEKADVDCDRLVCGLGDATRVGSIRRMACGARERREGDGPHHRLSVSRSDVERNCADSISLENWRHRRGREQSSGC
jgi:hypothetical protein